MLTTATIELTCAFQYRYIEFSRHVGHRINQKLTDSGSYFNVPVSRDNNNNML